MLDIQFIRDNTELVKKSVKLKQINVDIDKLLGLDEKRRDLVAVIEKLRAERNELAKQLSDSRNDNNIEQGKALKENITTLEAELEPLEKEYKDLLWAVPNIIPDDTPEGGEEDNREEKKWGKTEPDFEPVDHVTFGEQAGVLDFERGAKVAGNKFYYFKGWAVELELAVMQYVMREAIRKGFTPMTVPHMVNSQTAAGTGFLPRGEERQIYQIEGEDLNLIATAEIPITGYHSNETLDLKNMPLKYAGISPSYRLEAGAYGKHSKGLFRVHQFNKVELYVFCKPEDSESWHKKMVEFEEELCQNLEIPYRLVRIAAGDLGAPAYKKYDIEYWSPVDRAYRELMSCSNVTDYQARRLAIKYRDEGGQTQYLHTLNGTAMAFSRTFIALVENHQTKDGKFVIPKVLRPYFADKTEF